jgi:hypothetical protein
VALARRDVQPQVRRFDDDVVVAEQDELGGRYSRATIAGARSAEPVLHLERDPRSTIGKPGHGPRGDLLRAVVDHDHLVAI